jgi:hypothetical protein
VAKVALDKRKICAAALAMPHEAIVALIAVTAISATRAMPCVIAMRVAWAVERAI